MTENEAIKVVKTEKACVVRNIKGCDRDCANCDLLMKDEDILQGYDMAIQALEKIQAYRAYKEIFENNFSKEAIELLSDKEEFGKWLERNKWIVKKCDEINRELEAYRAIGTVEECRVAVERIKPKMKPLKAYDDELGTSWCSCPNCAKGIGWEYERHFNFCNECGTEFDWSE